MMWIGAAVNALQNLLDDITNSLTDTAHVRALDWERGKVVFEYADGNVSRRIPLCAGTEREQEHVAALRQRVESLDAVGQVPPSAESFTTSIDSVQSIFPSDGESARSLDADRASLCFEQESGKHATNQSIVATPRDTTAFPIAIPQATLGQLASGSTDSICSFSPSIEITTAALVLHTEPPQIHANDREPSAIPIHVQDVSSLLPSPYSESVALDRQGASATNVQLNQPNQLLFQYGERVRHLPDIER